MEFQIKENNIGNIKYTVIANTVMGFGKIENQDSLAIYTDEYQCIVVIADGLGSATYSKEGSSKIVNIAVEILKESSMNENIALEILKRWKAGLSGNLNLYDTTLKFIKITEKCIEYGGVGDGWIAINTDDEFISLCAQNTFSNQTDSILSFDLKNKFVINKIENINVKNMLISTDGFSEDMDKEHGKEFLDDVYKQIEIDQHAFDEDIKNTLENWPVESNKDDKTVIFIQAKEA